jgi:hypothetical protein
VERTANRWHCSLRNLPALVIAAAGSACVYNTPTPQVPREMRTYNAVDVAASEVRLSDTGSDLDTEDDAAAVRADVAEFLTDPGLDLPASAPPVRFRAKVEYSNERTNSVGLVVCTVIGLGVLAPITCGIFVVAGGKTWMQSAHVEIELETRGGLYFGQGDARTSGGLYVSARRRAIAEALRRALADAAEKGPVRR